MDYHKSLKIMTKVINSMPFTSKCVNNLKTQLQINDDHVQKCNVIRSHHTESCILPVYGNGR